LILARRFFSPYWSLTVGYIATGKLALLLAVPPGYASPIFPPAGIAIAAMPITGRATLVWTFLGSFLLNVWTASSVGRGSAAVSLACGRHCFGISTASLDRRCGSAAGGRLSSSSR
jgi:hypothetical protein